MTNLASLIRAAQTALNTVNASTDWSDPDTLSDAQLEWLAGPGHVEYKTWDATASLPITTVGLMHLAGMIEASAEAGLNIKLRKAAGPGYNEFEAWALHGQAPKTDAGKKLVEAAQAAGQKETR